MNSNKVKLQLQNTCAPLIRANGQSLWRFGQGKVVKQILVEYCQTKICSRRRVYGPITVHLCIS